MLGGLQGQPGYFGEGKTLLPVASIEPRFVGRPARKLINIVAELFRTNSSPVNIIYLSQAM
jgi:hypothetical protein